MDLPEISHRCPSCGAAVREFGGQALFCPECGKALVDQPAETASQSPAEENVPEVAPQPVAEAAPVADTKAPITPQENPGKPPVEERPGARERTRETLHRASSRARGAIEGNVKRVEKIHHVSSVMFEEAHYDPSLRFVLVAVGLFLVFVILLVLSKVMG